MILMLKKSQEIIQIKEQVIIKVGVLENLLKMKKKMKIFQLIKNSNSHINHYKINIFIKEIKVHPSNFGNYKNLDKVKTM